jgi:catechol 2,3-dioxygenase-like lactoylglutathione lyase family enzyme
MTADAMRGYAHVNIVVNDLDAAHDFYGRKLGLELLPRPDFGRFGGAWYRLGAAQLHLSVVERMPEWNNGVPHFALYVPADDFLATVDKLESAGVEFTSPPRTREDFGVPVQAAFCRDPAGNMIELTDVAPFG